MIKDGDNSGAWERLGTMLIQRRSELGYAMRPGFCEATGLNIRLVADIEKHARTNFSTAYLTKIEQAYQLRIGSIATFLAGGDLEPYRTAPLQPEPSDRSAPFRPERSLGRPFPDIDKGIPRPIQVELAQIEGRWKVARAMHPDEEMQGSWLFPDNPAEAKGWDELGIYGLNDWERAQGIAWQRIYEAARDLGRGSSGTRHQRERDL